MGSTSNNKLAIALGIAVLAVIGLVASTVTFAILYKQEKDDNDDNNKALITEPDKLEAVTLWWVIFNKPENCITDPTGPIKCGPVDAFGQDFLDTQAAGQPDLTVNVKEIRKSTEFRKSS